MRHPFWFVKSHILKSDKFKKARGGPTRLLEICCVKCGTRVCLYQKDGIGLLKRMYLDRMIDPVSPIDTKTLACAKCGAHLGNAMIYEKENRPAFRLELGAIMKKSVK